MDVFNELEEEGKIQRTRSSILPNEKYSKVVLYLLQFLFSADKVDDVIIVLDNFLCSYIASV